MPRIRSIRPEFFSDVKMASLSPYARLFYQALWCFADDEGRGRCLVRELEGFAFPHEPDVRAAPLLEELIQDGRIVTYRVSGDPVYAIPTFHDHQKPNRPTGSTILPPEEADPGSLIDYSQRSHGGMAWDAAGAAAWAAARAAVEPTVRSLQDSALDLLDRMCRLQTEGGS